MSLAGVWCVGFEVGMAMPLDKENKNKNNNAHIKITRSSANVQYAVPAILLP